jgi:caffeoyl-CoA O-methyltransferase
MHLLPAHIEQYLDRHASPQDPLLARLYRDTHLRVQMPQMASGHLQGLCLEAISRMIRPRRILEIGTFTGYSALCLAKGLSTDGLLYTLDINEELEPVFAPYFEQSGMGSQIRFVAGAAADTILQIDETFDLVFIDADKANYGLYYDLIFPKLRMGGWILVDNVLWSGRVAMPDHDKDTDRIHAFNQKIAADPRIRQFILPIRDGITIAEKVGE